MQGNYDNEATYSGSNRDVDEYNRHGKYWSHYQKIGTDKRGNDVISFRKGRGVYPDSTYINTTFVGKHYDTIVDEDDYRYSRRMSRWDGFYDPFFYTSYCRGIYPYWYSRWGWYDPWFVGYRGFCSPWYQPWYDDYFYGYSYPYYYPYGYYGYYGYAPYYNNYYYGWARYPFVRYTYSRGHTGTLTYYDRYNNRSYSNQQYGSTYDNRRYGRRGDNYNRRSNMQQSDVVFGTRRPSTDYSSPVNNGRRDSAPVFQSTPRSAGGTFGGGSFGSGTGRSNSSGGFHGGGSFGGGRR